MVSPPGNDCPPRLALGLNLPAPSTSARPGPSRVWCTSNCEGCWSTNLAHRAFCLFKTQFHLLVCLFFMRNVSFSKEECYPSMKREGNTHAVKCVFMQKFYGSFSGVNRPLNRVWESHVLMTNTDSSENAHGKYYSTLRKRTDNLGYYFSLTY